MSKVKILIDADNTEVCERMTKFFKQEDIEFEIETNAARTVKTFFGEQNSNPSRRIDERISHIFITVGIPAHIKGYQFLRSAIKLAVEKPGIINSITKQLYPAIAKMFSTTASKVERAIRHAIEVGWNRGRADRVNDIFGVKAFDRKDKPTNGEFIALIADKMLLEGA
jgi:two-component system response regulator (stage 0 sporulation protein A)